MFKHYSRKPRVVQTSYYVNDVAALYNFPPGDGLGQKIGIIELGGGYTLSDLLTYGEKLNLPPVNITAISVDGAINNPSDTSGASHEVMLDIEVIYTMSPRASLRVYFAPNTDQGFANAIKQAVTDKCDIISISWGGSEDSWQSSTIQLFEQIFQQAAQAGITILAAAGDNGYLDSPYTTNPTVDYPASSQWVTACGGTQLGNQNEVVWNNLAVGEGATGGGMSSLFVRPEWQTRDHIDKVNRCVPDLTANASPLTGYNIYMEGQWTVVAGTSAVAPLYAGLVARINSTLGKNVGYLNPVLYTLNENSFYDVTQGSNGWWMSNKEFDLTSGLGRIDGTYLIENIEWTITSRG